jgi:hypothetical protein
MGTKLGFLALAGALLLILPSPLVLAGPAEHLDWGAQLHSGPSSCPNGAPIINVTQKVLNDADSGVAGNAWAFDDLVRQIRVVQTDTSTFCATVKYQGSFTTVAGPSPENTGTVGAGVVGTFEGGYTAILKGTLKETPGARTRGSIGTFDYQCDTSFNCPGTGTG